MARLALRLGWGAVHWLLYPVTAYFLLFSPAPQRAAARRYLARALGRAPARRDLFRLYFTFASTILDRVFLLSGRLRGYEIRVSGLEAVQSRVDAREGCILLGAHLGSFEVLRALAASGCPVEVRALMYEDNAAQANAFFNAIAPGVAAMVIPLGRPDTMLRAKECLERGGLIGILADRAPHGERTVPVPLLGAPAALPVGPHLLASVLGAPVVLAFGLWTGPRRYEIRFESFSERIRLDRADRAAGLAASVGHYAARVEALCREHPYNWFNFYDFWQELDPPCAPADATS
nr:acyltransferase [Roseomonas acroporae]